VLDSVVVDRTAAARRRARVTALAALVLVVGCGRGGEVRPDAGADATAGSFVEAAVGGAGGDAPSDAADAADAVVAQPDTSADGGDDVVDGGAADTSALGSTYGELPDAGVGFGFCSSGAWCWSAPPSRGGIGADLHGVWGSGPNDVWAVGDGTILHWNGDAWSRVLGDDAAAFGGVWGTGPADVWAVGSGGAIVHWDGATLARVAGGGTSTLTAVWGSGPEDVWAVGGAQSGSVALHYDGHAWTSVATQTLGQLRGVWGSGSRDVWALGGATVLHWDGVAWSSTQLSSSNQVETVWASGRDDLWALGPATSLHWDGNGWFDVSLFPGTSPVAGALWGTAANDVWNVGHDDGSLLRFDGQQWKKTDSLAPMRANAMWGSSAGDVWVVGDAGSIAHLSRGAWDVPQGASGAGDLVAVWGSRADDVWALGDQVALHWDGASWTATPPLVPSDSTLRFFGLWGSGADDVWAVGGGVYALDDHTDPSDLNPGPALIVHWDGKAWQPSAGFDPMTTYGFVLHGVWGSGADDVWAVGGGSGKGALILRWNGTTWASVASHANSAGALKAVWGSGADDVWAVGGATFTIADGPLLLHWDGHAWSDQTPPAAVGAAATPALNAVWGSGADDVWAVGGSEATVLAGGTPIPGVIEHWDGKAWMSTIPADVIALEGVWGGGPNDVWAVGGGGAILHFAGAGWSPQTSGAHDALFAVWGSAPDDVWVVGDDGAILHR